MKEERIRELARQSGLKMIHDETLALGYLNTPTKKFAELIVRECADVCERFGESGDGYTCSAEILDHFGVVE